MASRQAWVQAHKWLGLLLALPVVVLCLSGAALVWPGAIERLAAPQRYATSGIERLAPGDYAAAVTMRLRPGERIARLGVPAGRAPVVVATDRRSFYLDPPTAHVLDVAGSDTGAVVFLRTLHASLWLPGKWSLALVGAIGLAMLLATLTGLWLWPPAGEGGLHRLLGLWGALPLVALSLTGIGSLDGSSEPAGAEPSRPAAATRLTVGDAIERAQALRSGTLRRVIWPTERKPDWTIELTQGITVKVADDDGTAALARRSGGRASLSLLRRLHDGTGMGTVWRAAIFLAGVLSAILAVTGVVITWRNRWAVRRVQARAPLP